MQATPSPRAPVPISVLWKWTSVSAILHALIIASLCGVSYWGMQKKEAATKAKTAQEEAAAKAQESEDAAKAAKDAGTNPPATAPTGDAPASHPSAPAAQPGATPAPNRPAPQKAEPEPAQPPAQPSQAQAEKILGIDKVAKPDEIPKSPFNTKGDDLLKDLK
jgi:hypothetical protein